MTLNEDLADWVPDACTLPTVEQPVRVAEFDQLFARALTAPSRPNPTRMELVIDTADEAWARNLTERENGCCSFFTFGFMPVEQGVVLRVDVPAGQVAVLESLSQRAAAARTSDRGKGSADA